MSNLFTTKNKLIAWHIIGVLLFIPLITVCAHEAGHAIWVYLTFGNVTDFYVTARGTGFVNYRGGVEILISAGAYSSGPAVAMMLLRKYGLKAILPSIGFCWVAVDGIVSYFFSAHGFHGSDFKYGLPAVVTVAVIQVVVINLFSAYVFPRIRSAIRRFLARPQSVSRK
jgi:hypothetical protein